MNKLYIVDNTNKLV